MIRYLFCDFWGNFEFCASKYEKIVFLIFPFGLRTIKTSCRARQGMELFVTRIGVASFFTTYTITLLHIQCTFALGWAVSGSQTAAAKVIRFWGRCRLLHTQQKKKACHILHAAVWHLHHPLALHTHQHTPPQHEELQPTTHNYHAYKEQLYNGNSSNAAAVATSHRQFAA